MTETKTTTTIQEFLSSHLEILAQSVDEWLVLRSLQIGRFQEAHERAQAFYKGQNQSELITMMATYKGDPAALGPAIIELLQARLERSKEDA